ncbi:VOC family protein [Knoellia subterranea]|uniref:Glyoxalase n=1 Tax=Knoellia subterranea KCTC 19937 TaxID=1385521 RepID=A0A0A0JTJ7_9MICO|nr:VOC family protein [Knoellia subterranea]KGN39402.1 glyoxalase [Knoellia subterranea KCTC 19937]
MDQRISFVTLGVHDLDVTRRFYVDGLGWQPELDVAGEVIMFSAGPLLVLSLWDRAHMAEEIGTLAPADLPGVLPITIAHNVQTPAEVDAVLADARRAGASLVSDAVERDWGGYTGYFADPDGFRWEVAHNPGPIGESVLPPAGDDT